LQDSVGVEKNEEAFIFRTLKLDKGEDGKKVVDIKGEMDIIFDGEIKKPNGESIEVFFNAGTLAMVGHGPLVTIASNFEEKPNSRITWEDMPSLAMKPLLSTLDPDYSTACKNPTEETCKFMEPIMLFDIHSWASTECVAKCTDQDTLRKSPIYAKYQLMKNSCTHLLKKALARGGQKGQAFIEDFKAAKTLIKQEHKALLDQKETNKEQSLLQRYNEVAIRLWPWDIVGVEVGKNRSNAEKLRQEVDCRRSKLKNILEEVLNNHATIDEIITHIQQTKNEDFKIFLKFFEAQYSGWVARNKQAEVKYNEDILNQVPKNILSSILNKILARLAAPLKMMHYDIDKENQSSYMTENPAERLEHEISKLQQGEDEDGLLTVFKKVCEENEQNNRSF
jgi:hypothetical protein